MTPLCKDCAHFRPDRPAWMYFIPVFGWLFMLVWMIGREDLKFAVCAVSPSPLDDNYYRVTGRHQRGMAKLNFCSAARRSMVTGDCGEDGILFEARQ